MPSWREHLALGWGKIRRSWLVAFRPRTVETMLDRRRGMCTRCGACCKLLFQCPAYDESDGNPKCLIYNDRPGVCGLFPLDEKDLLERDIVMPERSCGFYFSDTPRPNGNGNGNGNGHAMGNGNGNGNGKSNGHAKPRPVSMPVRLRFKPGDDENGDGSKRLSFLRTPLAFLGAALGRPGSGSTMRRAGGKRS